MTNEQKIEVALDILRTQDWYWFMEESTRPHYDNARGTMRAFVKVVATISDQAIVEALRSLWTATYTYLHETMWGADEKVKAEFAATKAQLLAIIQPQHQAAA